MNRSVSSPWYCQLGSRIATLWPLKAIGTSAFMAVFFWAYFSVMAAPASSPVVMPRLFLDHAIPFSTLAFPAYVSLWVYVSLPTALMPGFRPLLLLGLWSAALCLFCLGVFWALPTAVPPAEIDWQLYPEMAFIKGIDAAGNACPSLHVASAVFSAVWLARVLANVGAPVWLRWASGLQCAVIMWSTVATRQHVVLDVIAGALVGLAFGWASLRQIESALGPQRL
ncbi:MAG: phosphatase PAP2 family protein [Azonexus sp.]|nr:phosphatase PAP2 family protein [Azonexus sp.]